MFEADEWWEMKIKKKISNGIGNKTNEMKAIKKVTLITKGTKSLKRQPSDLVYDQNIILP